MNDFFSTSLGRTVLIAIALALLGGSAWMIWSNVGPSAAVAAANDPIFIDADTGYAFHCKLVAGMSIPVVSPDTGKANGYPAELCYWTKDGHVKSDPTPVLLNTYRGKSGPTFCPDCGRLVVPVNPMAIEGHRPPPTEADYWAERGQTPPAN